MTRPRVGLLLLACITSSWVVTPRPARADDVIPKRYTRHFNSGVVHYRAGRYDAALKEFLAAALVKQRVNAVLNIAQCHRMLGRPGEAIKFYRSYLEQWKREHPGKRSPFHDEVQRHIRDLSKQIKPVGPAPASPGGDTTRPTPTRAPLKLTPPSKGPAQRSSSPPFFKKWWFWTVVSVVVVGTVTAAVVASQPEQVDPVTGTLGHGPYSLP